METFALCTRPKIRTQKGGIIMGWRSWFRDKGDDVKEKTVRTSEGKETHWLRSKDGDKENHSHVVVKEKDSGHKSAHGNGPKNER